MKIEVKKAATRFTNGCNWWPGLLSHDQLLCGGEKQEVANLFCDSLNINEIQIGCFDIIIIRKNVTNACSSFNLFIVIVFIVSTVAHLVNAH